MNKQVVFGAGRTLFKQGDKDTDLYFIIKGEIELIIKDDDAGHQAVITTIGEKSVLGTMSFLEGEPRSATAIAKTEVVYIKVSELVRERILNRVPKWFGVLIKDLTTTIRNLDKKYLKTLKDLEDLNQKIQVKDKYIEKLTADLDKAKKDAILQHEKEEDLNNKLKESEVNLRKVKEELAAAQQKLAAKK